MIKFNNIKDSLEDEIANYLYDYHMGINHSISNHRLADKFNLDERTLRQLIVNLIVKEGIPIGSSSKNHSGIYFISCDQDYKIASDELMSRIRKLSKRHKCNRHNWTNWKNDLVNKQLTLSGVG